MLSVSVRKLLHHFSDYLKKIESGERIIVLKRNIPIADIVPHYANVQQPKWKRIINKIHVKGVSFSKSVSQLRKEDR